MDSNAITDLFELLAACPLFHGLANEDIRALAAIAEPREAPRATQVFAEGDRAEGFFIVGRGRVKVYKISPEGKEQILQFIGPGDTFAEAAVFSGATYPASVECVEPSMLVFFPKAQFQRLVAERPPIALNMIGALSRRLRALTSLVEDLALKAVGARLAHYLIQAAGEDTTLVTLDVSKAALAARLGSAAETLSRTFAKLEQQGLVAVEGASIRILDRDSLRALAMGQEMD